MSGEVKRDFGSMLDELMASDRDAAGGPAPSVAFDYLSVADELHSGRITVSSETATAEYREMAGLSDDDIDELFAAASEPAADEVLSIEPDDISRELGLAATSQPAELARIRRAFAFRNHPDRVAPHLRQRAMMRMQVANMLIDEARRRTRT